MKRLSAPSGQRDDSIAVNQRIQEVPEQPVI